MVLRIILALALGAALLGSCSRRDRPDGTYRLVGPDTTSTCDTTGHHHHHHGED